MHSDHLQLIKFWRSCVPGKGVCGGGGGNFGSALLQPSRTLCVYGGTAAGAQCVRLSERFFVPGCGSAKFTEIGIKSCQRYRQRSLLPRISGAIVYSVEDITRGGTVSEGSQANRVLPVRVSGCVPVDSASWRDPAAQNITRRPSESSRRPGDVTQGSRDCLVRAPLKRLTFKLSLPMSKMK